MKKKFEKFRRKQQILRTGTEEPTYMYQESQNFFLLENKANTKSITQQNIPDIIFFKLKLHIEKVNFPHHCLVPLPTLMFCVAAYCVFGKSQSMLYFHASVPFLRPVPCLKCLSLFFHLAHSSVSFKTQFPYPCLHNVLPESPLPTPSTVLSYNSL